MLSLRAHGWTRNLPDTNLVTGQKSQDAFEESFKFVLPGYNLRPLEMSGAIGQEQLLKLPMIVENRRKNAVLFKEVAKEFNGIISQKEIGESSWFGFSMVLNPDCGIERSALVASLQNHGVECRPIVAGNFAKNDVVKKYFDYEIHGTLKNAEYIDGAGLFIGNHHYALETEMDALRSALKAAFT
jgi:CDP-6-deoxy-D-xylo-4-hexulose-3-dehydrase